MRLNNLQERSDKFFFQSLYNWIKKIIFKSFCNRLPPTLCRVLIRHISDVKTLFTLIHKKPFNVKCKLKICKVFNSQKVVQNFFFATWTHFACLIVTHAMLGEMPWFKCNVGKKTWNVTSNLKFLPVGSGDKNVSLES